MTSLVGFFLWHAQLRWKRKIRLENVAITKFVGIFDLPVHKLSTKIVECCKCQSLQSLLKYLNVGVHYRNPNLYGKDVGYVALAHAVLGSHRPQHCTVLVQAGETYYNYGGRSLIKHSPESLPNFYMICHLAEINTGFLCELSEKFVS